MKAPFKIHKAVSEERRQGFWTGTLCGRESSKSDDGTNAETADSEVTCAFCRAIMGNAAHWANRRFLSNQASTPNYLTS